MLRYLVLALSLLTALFSCSAPAGEPAPPAVYEVSFSDQTLNAPFGPLPIRIYYPGGFTGKTFVIHISRGGSGFGNDLGQMLSYVEHFVENGFVVIQTDHRNAGSDIPLIAQYRGEEISFIASVISAQAVNFGDFQGSIDPKRQGFIGHSGGCMEGLEAAGTVMTHGVYAVPEIVAVYGISPAGYNPDQFGITPAGFAGIGTTAVFVAVGEQELDVNGTGQFMSKDWRLQAYTAMSKAGPRFQALVKGPGTGHNDMNQDNPTVLSFNKIRALAFFDMYLRGINRKPDITAPATSGNLTFEVSSKGL